MSDKYCVNCAHFVSATQCNAVENKTIDFVTGKPATELWPSTMRGADTLGCTKAGLWFKEKAQ
jgi:hypothetical protein